MSESEQLAACRHRAAKLANTDAVQLSFDWRPTVTDNHVVFLCSVTRGGHQSSIEFVMALDRLNAGELAQLHSFLAQQHAGFGNGYTVTRSIVWLLSIALEQQGTAVDQIAAKVRELLLTQTD